MSGVEAPIQLSVVHHPMMQDMHVDLRLLCRSLDADAAVDVALTVRSRVLTHPTELSFSCGPAGSDELDLGLSLRDAQPGTLGFDLEAVVTSTDGSRRAFRGKFRTLLFAKGESPQRIALTLHNEVNAAPGGFVADNQTTLSLPDVQREPTINDMLTRAEIEHRVVLVDAGDRGSADADPVALQHLGTAQRWLLFTGPSLTLGRGGVADSSEPDVITRFLPVGTETDTRSRAISGRQCRLVVQGGRVVLEHLSRSNPTRLEGNEVPDRTVIPAERPSSITLPQAFRLSIRPVPALGNPGGLGAVRLERLDDTGSTEAYVWLLAPVDAAAALGLEGSASGFHLEPAGSRVLARPADGAMASRPTALAAGGSIALGTARLRVVARRQEGLEP